MPETLDGKKVFTLSEFAASIQRAIGKFYNSSYWLKAEISKLNLYTRSGHCYPELIESNDGNISASFTGFIQKNIYQKLNAKFLSTIGEPLHDGMKVIAQCSLHYSMTRGMRLTINDIDINAIIGEQARKRQENVEKLKSEGIFAKNKAFPLPRIVRRIAVVSVETGKGYADFMSIINAADGVRISTRLFPALIMGPEAAGQMSSALDRIMEHVEEFDAVCIVRGGGGENTLQCFNDLELCRKIALFPLPVMTGIGHATNRTVAEEVANTSFVSPSEVANFLIDRYSGEISKFNALKNKISLLLQRALQSHSNRLYAPIKNIRYKYSVAFRRKNESVDALHNSIKLHIDGVFNRHRYRVHAIASRIAVASNGIFQKSRQRIEAIEGHLHGATVRQFPIVAGQSAQLRMAAEPVNGYVIMRGEQAIDDISALHAGDIIRIIAPNGSFTAEVKTLESEKL
ncbi:MAG: exodeoxyribonuclease VII large subunit [Bacteroidales bacterium]|nr:exodeoxyribonuclease VII large subunit [Bacteroidales bacterium]